MDYDYIENIRHNSTSRDFILPLDYIYTLVSLASSVADVLIVYSVLRFKNMRTKRNLIFLHWTIADLLNQIMQPSKMRVLAHIFELDLHHSVYCILYTSSSAYLCIEAAFVIVLSVNWIYKRATTDNLKYIAAVIWIFLTVEQLIAGSYCVSLEIMMMNYFASFILFLTCLCSYLVQLCLYSIRRINGEEKRMKVRYILTSVFAVTSFVNLAAYMFDSILFEHANENFVHPFIWTAEFLSYINALINIFILVRYDKNFRLCIYNTCICSPASNIEEVVTYAGDDDSNILNMSSGGSHIDAED